MSFKRIYYSVCRQLSQQLVFTDRFVLLVDVQVVIEVREYVLNRPYNVKRERGLFGGCRGLNFDG